MFLNISSFLAKFVYLKGWLVCTAAHGVSQTLIWTGGAGPGSCPHLLLLLLLLHVIRPRSNGTKTTCAHEILLLPLQLGHGGVDVLLPLLHHPVPLTPAVLPHLVWSSGHSVLPICFGNQTNVFVVRNSVLSVGYLFLSPKTINYEWKCNCKLPNKNSYKCISNFEERRRKGISKINYLLRTSSSVSISYFGTLNSTIASFSEDLLLSSSRVFFILVLRSSVRTL